MEYAIVQQPERPIPRDLPPNTPEQIAIRVLVDRLFGDKPEEADDE